MRFALVLLIALAACGAKKKSPQSPGATESKELSQDKDEKNVNAPADADDPKDMKSDPQEGGE
jgi:hypothetical protein